MLYLHTQIILALTIAVLLGWFITKLLYQSRENELQGDLERLRSKAKGHEEERGDWEARINQLKQSEHTQAAKTEALVEEKHALQGKVIRLDKEIETQQSEIKNDHRQINQVKRELDATALHRDGFKNRLSVALQKIEFSKLRFNALEIDHKKAQQQLEASQEERHGLTTQTISLSHQKEDYHGQLNAKSNELEALKDQLLNMESQRDDAQKRLRAAHTKNDELNGTINMATRERDSFESRNGIYSNTIEELKQQLGHAVKERDELRIRLFTVEELTSQITLPMKSFDDAPTEVNIKTSSIRALE